MNLTAYNTKHVADLLLFLLHVFLVLPPSGKNSPL